MRKQAFQYGEIRDENDNVIRKGAYGKMTDLANIQNNGFVDYVINNFDAVVEMINGAAVYVDSKDKLPATGIAGKRYVASDTGASYEWDAANSKYVELTGKIDGASAYELAVANGYKGTQAEWLASLKGDKGDAGASITGATVDSDGYMTLTLSTGDTIKTALQPIVDCKSSAAAAKASETAAASSATTAQTAANDATSAASTVSNAINTIDKNVEATTTAADNAKTSETNAAASATTADAASQTAKSWAVSAESPDGSDDTDSSTGKTKSARSWALDSKSSASAAKTSETNAATSATSASNSADAARTSATDAASSASAASLSESSAIKSATSATASAKSAIDSASAASASATNASNSEANASDYKTSAKTSETNASAYASSASKSETNAKAAMNSAQTSATSASTSATNASKSATNAAASETSAKTAQAAAESARDRAEEAVAKLTGVMKYAGQVDNYSDLDAKTKNKGDVWNIVNADPAHGIKAGDNVAWNGTDWDDLSGTVDLSIYAEKADYQKAITSATANGATITFNHKDGTTSTATVNNVASAASATNDAKGQKIDATYEKIADASNVHTSLQNSINTKQDKLTFDTTPTANSSNPVTSGGIKTALDTKPDKTGEGASGTWGINITGNAKTATKATQDASGNVITTTYAKKSEIPSVPVKGVKISGSTSNLTPDNSGIVTIPAIPTKVSTFTNDSGYLTTHQDLSGYQTKLTFDSTPTANSSNPVTSAGIKAAIDAKTVDLSNYYTKTQVDSAISTAISAIVDGDNKRY